MGQIDKRKSLGVYWLLVGLQGLLALFLLLRVPSEAQSAWLFGYSKSRLALAVIPLGLTIVAAWLALRILRKPELGLSLVRELDALIYTWKFFWLLFLIFLLGAIAGGVGFWLQYTVSHTTVQAVLTRIGPLLLLVGLLGLQSFIFLFVLGYYTNVLQAGKQTHGSNLAYLGSVAFRSIGFVCLIVGVALMGINIYGLFPSLRNPQLYEMDGHPVSLTPEEVYALVDRQPGEENVAYVKRLTSTVKSGVAHYWEDEGVDLYHMRVPLTENYLLYFASLINPKRYLAYEFCNYRKAIERGVGLCSQYSLILTDILNDNDVETRIVKLDGHVVALALIDPATNTWWIVDGDNNVVIEDDISVVEQDPNMIQPYFEARGYSQEYIDTFTAIYGVEGNVVISGGNDFDGGGKCTREGIYYALKWALPVLLIAPFLVWTLRRKVS